MLDSANTEKNILNKAISAPTKAGKYVFKRAWKYTCAMALSTGKVVSAAGQALFGTQKIFSHFEKVRHVSAPPLLESITCKTVMTGAVIINILNRATTIFSTVLAEEPNKTQQSDDIDGYHPIAFHGDSHEDPVSQYSFIRRSAHHTIYYTVAGGAAISAGFASANAYLGGIKFLTYLVNTDVTETELDAMIACSAFIALSSCYSNFAYNFPPSRDNAKAFAEWLTSPIINFSQKCADAYGYRWTFLKCSLNIIAQPFQAFFSTTNTFEVMGLNRYLGTDTISSIAAASTLTAFTSNLFSTVPSTHQYMTPNPAIQRGLDNLPFWGKVYYRTGLTIGFEDSLATGAGAVIAVISTTAILTSSNEDNIGILIGALFCGASSAYTTQAFSVKYGLVKRLAKWYPEQFSEDFEPAAELTEMTPYSSNTPGLSRDELLQGYQGSDEMIAPPVQSKRMARALNRNQTMPLGMNLMAESSRSSNHSMKSPLLSPNSSSVSYLSSDESSAYSTSSANTPAETPSNSRSSRSTGESTSRSGNGLFGTRLTIGTSSAPITRHEIHARAEEKQQSARRKSLKPGFYVNSAEAHKTRQSIKLNDPALNHLIMN